MYESEVYLKFVQEILPQEVFDHFLNTYNNIQARSILHWTEHCTECSMPQCFKTCDLYSPRIDGKCSRFVRGIERVKQHQLPDDIEININTTGSVCRILVPPDTKVVDGMDVHGSVVRIRERRCFRNIEKTRTSTLTGQLRGSVIRARTRRQ